MPEPLQISYFVCDSCAQQSEVMVTFCMSCSNIACPHLFFGMQCFQCARIKIDWPDWHMRFPLKACGTGKDQA